MAVYALDAHTESADTLTACLTKFHLKFETLVTTKTVRHTSVHKDGNQWSYTILVDEAA
jgi:hypothetical protein